MYSQKTKDGKVRFFESYIDPKTKERKRTSVTLDKNTAATRKQATELLSARIRELESTTWEQTHHTLKEISDAYFAARGPQLREQTVVSHRYSIDGALSVIGATTIAEELTAAAVIRAFDACDESATWKNEKLKRFKTMMRWAYRMEMIPSWDYLDKIPRYSDDAKSRRAHKYLEREELDALLEAMTVTHHRQLTLFLALSGCRIGEALALRPEDVDLDKRQIHITKTYISQLEKDGPTKTAGSTRDIYIQEELIPLLKEIRPGTYFFDHGGRVHYAAYKEYLAAVSLRTLGRKITPHTLRHTHTSLLAAAGVPLETIARRLGHQDTKTTLDIYMHVTKQLQKRDEALLDKAKLTVKAT